MTQTFKLVLAYDGTHYAGWQIQKNAVTVQEVIERAVATIVGRPVRVLASGRTDSGVHALAQVVSCTVDTRLGAHEFMRAINGNLPFDIRVTHAEPADATFDPTRDAIRKSYRYVIQDGRVHDVFERGYCWFVPGDLDVDAMRSAASHLVGEYDFASFQSAGSYRVSTIRHVDQIEIARRPDDSRFIDFAIRSNGFLYNMVRNIVGTVVQVGRGTHPPSWVRDVRNACDRQAAGPLSPPQGLFLVSVEYPAS